MLDSSIHAGVYHVPADKWHILHVGTCPYVLGACVVLFRSTSYLGTVGLAVRKVVFDSIPYPRHGQLDPSPAMGSANSALEGGELVCSCGGVASGAAVPASAPTGLLSASRRKSELLKSRRPTRDLNLKSEVSATFLTKKA